MFEPLYSPLFSSLLSPLIAAAQRVFITLNGTDAHYTIENPVTFAGDFDISLNLSATSVGNAMIFSGGTVTNGFELFFDSLRKLSFRYQGVDPGGLSSALSLSDLHLIRINRSSSTVELFIDGASSFTTTISGSVKIDVLGRRLAVGAFFLSGIIANPDFGNGNAWPINRLTANTEQSSSGNNLLTYVNIPTGAPDRELFTKNTSTDPDQWENADKSRIIQIA